MPNRTIVTGDDGQLLTYDAWTHLVTAQLSAQGIELSPASSRLRLYFDCGYTPSSATYAESTLCPRSDVPAKQVH